MKMLAAMADREKKLTALVFSTLALFAGLFTRSSDAKYEAFAYALAGMSAALMGSHAFQAVRTGRASLAARAPVEDDELLPSAPPGSAKCP